MKNINNRKHTAYFILSIMSILMPIPAIILERLLGGAQGEVVEELITGAAFGWLLGFVLAIITFIMTKISIKKGEVSGRVATLAQVCSIIGMIPFILLLVLFAISQGYNRLIA